MIISREEHYGGKQVIDLSGPDGNAFVLMGIAKRWARELDLDHRAIIDEMRKHDYEHLLKVFEEHFGNFCILVR